MLNFGFEELYRYLALCCWLSKDSWKPPWHDQAWAPWWLLHSRLCAHTKSFPESNTVQTLPKSLAWDLKTKVFSVHTCVYVCVCMCACVCVCNIYYYYYYRQHQHGGAGQDQREGAVLSAQVLLAGWHPGVASLPGGSGRHRHPAHHLPASGPAGGCHQGTARQLSHQEKSVPSPWWHPAW